ncbi:MAG: sulfatase-like hydrolase/transferase [Planctomycetes bacterium]|nr:sulfatase-like hydrolase/transferase [Planctomycetota bacterium]
MKKEASGGPSGSRRRPNVILIHTDQQRADSLGCMGNRYARTPRIDSLAERGVVYENHYASNPVCMPSRASLFTGRHVFSHRVLDNGIFLPETELTMAEVFRRNGYRTESIGKLHFQTCKPHEGDESMEGWDRWRSGEFAEWDGPYYGFEKIQVSIEHGEEAHGHYGLWREKNFPDLKLGPENATSPVKFPQFHSWKSNLPLEAHYSTWIADRAVEFLENPGENPFFLFVSFPDPHAPFTPPKPYSGMYDGVEFDPPHRVDGENDSKPKPWRDGMTGIPFPTDGGARWFPDFEGEAYNQVHAHTHGMISLIDDSIGRVLDKLAGAGLADNTIIAYTADHADFLGDHWFLFKGQLPSRSLLHIPMIVMDPSRPSGRVDCPTSTVDVFPTLCERCALEIPDVVQGAGLPLPAEAPRREYAFEAGWSKASAKYHHFTIYKRDWHISIYPYLADGEMYDLANDPHEHRNLFHDSKYASIRRDLVEELLFAVGKAEPPMPPILTDW